MFDDIGEDTAFRHWFFDNKDKLRDKKSDEINKMFEDYINNKNKESEVS